MNTCDYCGLEVTDDRAVSGFTGEGPDWASAGDFGCDSLDAPDAIAGLNSGSHAVDGVGPGSVLTADDLHGIIVGEWPSLSDYVDQEVPAHLLKDLAAALGRIERERNNR